MSFRPTTIRLRHRLLSQVLLKPIRRTLTKMASTAPIQTRPRLHITVPYWLNDPCAPGYDSRTGLYHLFYQCNPFDIEWGNMSWGHVTSKDLLHWTFANVQPALSPDRTYDKEGVFTGCMVPPNEQRQLRVFYSSICRLPFHWNSPYIRNTAGLATAVSEDSGQTWTKSDHNPILEGEPDGVKVSGYRDPYIAVWKGLDKLRGTNNTLYSLVSGSIVGKGPTSFLYAVHPQQPEKWQYLGPLVDMPLRWNPSLKWGGNFGVNWECVNFFTLTTDTAHSDSKPVVRDFLLIGAEGDHERDNIKSHRLPDDLPPRTIRTQMWMQGTLVKSSAGQIRLRHDYSGLFDHGPYYATNSFIDPQSSRRIVYGWIPEEDCSLELARRKGWNGALALPREVFIQTLLDVSQALHTPLQDITSIEIDKDQLAATKTTTIRTMGIRPLTELLQLRDNCVKHYKLDAFSLESSSSSPSGDVKHLVNVTDATWELDAVITIHPNCRSVGFHFNHSADLSVRTSLKFDVMNEEILLDRSKSISSDYPDLGSSVNTCTESGSFTLFTTTTSPTKAGSKSNTETKRELALEKLHIRIFNDGNCVEVFVNDRFTIATVVYTGHSENSNSDGVGKLHCGGISAFVDSDSNIESSTKSPSSSSLLQQHDRVENAAATFETVQIWDGLNGGRSLLSGWENVVSSNRNKDHNNGVRARTTATAAAAATSSLSSSDSVRRRLHLDEQGHGGSHL